MRTSFIRFLPACAFWISTAHATLTQPSDGPYIQLRRGHTLYVYDRADRDLIPDLVAYNEAYRARYDRSFDWKLDEEQDLILISPNTQDANAFAMNGPNIKSFWWGSGADWQEGFAISGWMPFLMAHETAHLYQINAKSRVGSALKTVFGNAVAVNPLVVPLFLRPNELLPTSFVEGNAVLNESRVNQGGRLFSGEIRALVLRLSAAGAIDATRLINDQFRFPFGRGSYYLGGYFQAHLAGKYGIDKTNAFFLAHGQRWLNPLRINATFREHFGASFYQEAREFTRGLELLSDHQKVTEGDWISTGLYELSLNHDADRVWWLATPLYRTPTLWQINKKTGEVSHRRVDVLLGKTFMDGDTPLVAGPNQNDLHHVTYGLYGEHNHLADVGRGEIVTDIRAGHRVGFSARDSWRDPRVIRDGEPYDVAHSRPILDDQGRTYYFRQSGPERHLYRDRQLIARVAGYYSKITEVDARGVVYFIGATTYGSSLFRFDGTETTRVLDSDAVVDARRFNATQFVVEEFDAGGVHVMIADQNPRAEKPAVYAYAFTSETITVPPTITADEVARAEKSYSGLRELRFGQLDFGWLASSYSGLTGTLAASFTDPLQFHDVQLGASYSGFGTRRAGAQYSYSRYLPRPYLRHSYGDLLWRTTEGRRRVIEQESNLGLVVKVWRHDRWDASVDEAVVFQQEGSHYEHERARINLGVYSHFSVDRAMNSPQGLYPWRQFAVNLSHRWLNDPGAAHPTEQAAAAQINVTHGFEGQYYLAAEAQYAGSDSRGLNVGTAPDLMPTAIGVPRLTTTSLSPAQTAARFRLEARQVTNMLFYDRRIPVGLERVGFVVAAQTLNLTGTDRGAAKTIFEYGYGVDANLLLAHKFNATTRLLLTHADDSVEGQPNNQLAFGLSGSF